MFSPAELQRIAEIKARYPEAKAALMPVLWMVQERDGWISETAMRDVATALEIPEAVVLGVVTFYTMYFDKPMGRYHVQVCTNVSCMLRGGDDLYRRVARELGVGHGERSADGKFSLEEVECMGACGGAPMIAINDEYHENVTAEQVLAMLKAL